MRQAGDVVEKDDLFEIVWPNVHVSEETLTQNISTIRQALGDTSEHPEYIATVPRRGYRFISAITKLGPRWCRAVSADARPCARPDDAH